MIGRNMIAATKQYVEAEFPGAEVIYGDSVTGPTPTMVRVAGRVHVETFERLADRWGGGKWLACLDDGREGKQSCELPGVDVWTEAGWTPARRVIRHLLAPEKRILRVLTHNGMVDATDDHSLLDAHGQAVSARDVTGGFELLHARYPALVDAGRSLSRSEARVMGMFCGDGSCVFSGKKTSWAIKHAGIPKIEYYRDLCERVYPECEWVIVNITGSSGTYKLVPRGSYGSIVRLVRKFRAAAYADTAKVVPAAILNASIEVRRAFWHGLCDAVGIEDADGYVCIEQNDQVSVASYALLASSLGYITSFDTRAVEPNVFRLTLTKRAQRGNAKAVKRVVEVDYDGWVYDMTTENHHFAAGAGRLVVHNTDSVMVKIPPGSLPAEAEDAVRKVEAAMGVGRTMGTGATDRLFERPISLMYEKVYSPFILVSKKRYGGLKFEKEGEEPEVDTKGLDLVRRDRIPLARELQGTILDLILNERNVHAAVTACRETAENLLAGRIGAGKLILSKQLKKEYKSVQPHVIVAEKIKGRRPGSEPRPGDRVPFVYLDVGDAKAKTTDMAEDPTYAEERGLVLNYEYYLTNCLVKPLSTILDLFVTHGKAADILFGDIIRKHRTKKNGNNSIESYYRPLASNAAPKRKWKDM
jgi:hypothetical protein